MRLNLILLTAFAGLLSLTSIGCSETDQPIQIPARQEQQVSNTQGKAMEKATFGGGCFWCVEAVFLQLDGVHSVKSGYMGGEVAIKGNGGTVYSLDHALPAKHHPVSLFLNGKKLTPITAQNPDGDYTAQGLFNPVNGRRQNATPQVTMKNPVQATDNFFVLLENPSYERVCTKTSGHAEVIHIEYDPTKVSFDVLLQVFWKTHDPTTPNRQGNDVGPQYRSAVFYHNEEQRQLASSYKKKLNETQAYPNPVVTEVSKATTFYVAEDYHQNYFANNPGNRYCQVLIPAKLEKLKKVFGDKLKK